ncbi:TPA: DUF2971 domain-containing protein [Klebsiella quasipneumoniae subsp. similipneumoniae]|nr:DUF2971 domain-containing protein [Klebsiella quasipneumoniae subsp. similipneumoniae]HBR1729531.1 DUF2971 domain-containing protein [Klebsiella quasipneumoniae subsp. similipneumoniae]
MKNELKNRILFKYRKYDEKGIDILLKQEIWFSTADRFNDPFEAETSFPEVLEAVWARKNLSAEMKKKFEDALVELISTVGVCAFSRARKNQLMWSHYADEHKGFCIGFREEIIRSENPKIHSLDVIYQSDFPFKNIISRINRYQQNPTHQNLLEIAGDISYSILRTKYSGWKYERERRLIKMDSGVVNFKPAAINSIAFGLRMKKDDRDNLRKLLSGTEWKHVKWFEAVKSKDKYALDFNQLD